MPLPEDTAPGRALELVEELGRVVVTSPHAQYSVTTDRRHVVRHAIVGGFVGWWVGGALALLVPWPSGRWVVVLAVLVVGAALWAGRFPPGARWWVQVDRYTPEEDVGARWPGTACAGGRSWARSSTRSSGASARATSTRNPNGTDSTSSASAGGDDALSPLVRGIRRP
ncbi:hypothetical protein G7075_09295 [Phycicoccus sp. HDW14]|uniref:hypothetical protein n=1 Tax=Phycicoccus sp. HDW14 TaxID=2714941 RepID=UPI00140B0118|nr:hypothetical protein [Phycicoccus sp. HDW14]QIM21283.1 hypothetical protein G7075_09295 [Phycicoccus sp. HDW14]